MIIGDLEKLFVEEYGEIPHIMSIAGGGSSRQYYRLSSGEISVVGVLSHDTQETDIFIRMCKYLGDQKVKVPGIIKISNDRQAYLLEDLGDLSLFQMLHQPDRLTISKKVLEKLVEIQTLPESTWKDKVGYQPFNERLVRWDLNYFKYDFLKPAALEFNESKLEDDFDKIVKNLTDGELIQGLMYRDFQSRNIMVKENDLYFIDFQGARKGPVTYDAVSFIWQAKAPFTFNEREDLCKYYAQVLAEKKNLQPDMVLNQMEKMELFRTLQVLGAYGFRGLIEKKSHFIESIPYALDNFIYLKDKGRLVEYEELEKIANKLYSKFCSPSRISRTSISNQHQMGNNLANNTLTVTIYSFSYKKGYPDDNTANGGGFIFDCRFIHNPGRYEEYKPLTGMDAEVIDFLEKGGEAKEFVENAIKIVSRAVDKYLDRGFTSLQVGFGCTGGQHRSVYCAERFADELKKLYPEVEIKLIHREQNIEK